MTRRRFIAGAVCPKCGAMDRLVLEKDGRERHCVACDYRDELPVASSQEPRTRLGGGLRRSESASRPVRILDPGSTPAGPDKDGDD